MFLLALLLVAGFVLACYVFRNAEIAYHKTRRAL